MLKYYESPDKTSNFNAAVVGEVPMMTKRDIDNEFVIKSSTETDDGSYKDEHCVYAVYKNGNDPQNGDPFPPKKLDDTLILTYGDI